MSEKNTWNKRIEIKNETQIKWVVVIIVWSFFAEYLYDLIPFELSFWPSSFLMSAIRFAICLPCILLSKTVGVYREEAVKDKDGKRWDWILWGLVMLAICYLWRAICVGFPAHPIFYFSQEFDTRLALKTVWWTFDYILIAFCEEYHCRYYLQGELSVILGRARFLAPVISAGVFAFMHYPQRGWSFLPYCFGAGLIWGFFYQYGKKCNFKSLVLCHFLLDFTAWIFDL